MKLIIFGASGGTGRQLLAQALEQGHSVTAFVRNPEKLNQKHKNLQIIKGDVLDLSAVEHAISGQDAVFCALGSPPLNKKLLRTNGTKNIIQAMENTSIKRLICQSGLGCGDSHDLLPFHYKYIIFPLMLRYVYADHELQEKHITASQLDWTIIRPAALTDGKHTDKYWHGFTDNDKSLTVKISRADVADFMLKQLSNNNYLYKTPCISYSNIN
jgi:putative NADH-flavin reductase